MSITAIVENDTIKLPVHVPDGTRVEITLLGERTAEATTKLAPTAKSPAFKWMLEFAGCIDGLPEDLAEHHTEYRTGRKQR